MLRTNIISGNGNGKNFLFFIFLHTVDGFLKDISRVLKIQSVVHSVFVFIYRRGEYICSILMIFGQLLPMQKCRAVIGNRCRDLSRTDCTLKQKLLAMAADFPEACAEHERSDSHFFLCSESVRYCPLSAPCWETPTNVLHVLALGCSRTYLNMGFVCMWI